MPKKQYREYTPCGGISQLWLYEKEKEREEKEREECENSIANIVKNISYGVSAQLRNGTKIDINNNNNNSITLEDKFNFLKAHSDNPEDLELAKQILGIK